MPIVTQNGNEGARVSLNSIPADLRKRSRWVCWKEGPKGPKDKPPKNPRTGYYADCNDPDTWGTFEEAVNALPLHDGLSFALNGDGIVGIDLDDCRDLATKIISERAMEIIQRFQSYTELSPSGTGIRIFVRGTLPAGRRKKDHVEVYDTSKFLSVTGNKLSSHGAGDGIQDRSAELLKWHREVFGDSTTPTNPTEKSSSSNGHLVINDPPIIDERRLHSLFRRSPEAEEIYNGGGHNQSNAEMSLANYAAKAGWRAQEVCDLLVAARVNVGESPKHLTYYETTIAKAYDRRRGHAPSEPEPSPKPPIRGTAGMAGRDGMVFPGGPGVVGEVTSFIGTYIVLPEVSRLVLAAWVVAAWLCDKWDRFPHLAITSPEKRCGKTLLMELLCLIVPRPRRTTNISPAALYRVVELEKPTLLMDESQSIGRRGSEASEVIREILNAGIDKEARTTRCGGQNHDSIEEFRVYSPKVFAMIGQPDAVLADRCLPVPMKRKTKEDNVERYRSRKVKEAGQVLHDKLEQWAEAHGDKVAEVYDELEPFSIDNDRMAELLTPLQAVLIVLEELEGLEGNSGGSGEGLEQPEGLEGNSQGVGGRSLKLLQTYASGLDERDREEETQSPGVRLLIACREIFDKVREVPNDGQFLVTDALIAKLVARTEEPWSHFTRNETITREALANLLRPYGVKSVYNRKRTHKGYRADTFREAWQRYLPPTPPTPSGKASDPSNPSIYSGSPKSLVGEGECRGGANGLAAQLAKQQRIDTGQDG